MRNTECYEDICPKANEGCEYAKVEEVFFSGSDGLGPCVRDSYCDEKLLIAIKGLGIKILFEY